MTPSAEQLSGIGRSAHSSGQYRILEASAFVFGFNNLATVRGAVKTAILYPCVTDGVQHDCPNLCLNCREREFIPSRRL